MPASAPLPSQMAAAAPFVILRTFEAPKLRSKDPRAGPESRPAQIDYGSNDPRTRINSRSRSSAPVQCGGTEQVSSRNIVSIVFSVTTSDRGTL